MTDPVAIDRGKGIAAWKQIADAISLSILAGDYDGTGMVPPEAVLAQKFGVNRHTVRNAIAALAEDGLLRRVQGRGTLVEKRERLVFPIGRRTRFSEGIGAQAAESDMRLLSTAIEDASPLVQDALGLAAEDQVVRLTILSSADGQPISLSDNYFSARRFERLPARFASLRSITKALAAEGVADYIRTWTEISARQASMEEVAALSLAAGGIVLETRGINAEIDARPIQYLRTVFAADRVSLKLETPGG